MKRISFVITLLLSCAFFNSCYANESIFSAKRDVLLFIDQMVKDYHFDKDYLIKLFNTVHIEKTIIKAMQQPPEQSQPWNNYKKRFITQERIQEGVIFWKKNENTLKIVEKNYGVPASLIVATLGVETHYGKNMGQYRVLDALSNLAFKTIKRNQYFRFELSNFLLLTREQKLNPLTLKGSYAGAIGKSQFMPSSYRKFAVSFLGKPVIDLIHDDKDAIASIANYYKTHGWQKNGVITKKIPLISRNIHPLLILEENSEKQIWRIYPNFNVIKTYNASNLYAMAVYQLSLELIKQRIRGKHA